jgi:hypothetical protein
MSDIIKFDPAIPVQFAEWFGQSALLTADDQRIHDRILCALFHDYRPQDFNTLILIQDLASLVCELLGLRRLRTNLIRKAHNQKFELQEGELLKDTERRKQEVRHMHHVFGPKYSRSPDAKTQTQNMLQREFEEMKLNKQLAEIDGESNKKRAEIKQAKEDTPIDEAECFDAWIDRVERIEKRMEVVERTIRITQTRLDEVRAGLGHRRRQVADDTIDVQLVEGAAPRREETAEPADSHASTEVAKALKESTSSTVAELPSPASSQSDGGTPVELEGPIGALPPSSGPAGQR